MKIRPAQIAVPQPGTIRKSGNQAAVIMICTAGISHQMKKMRIIPSPSVPKTKVFIILPMMKDTIANMNPTMTASGQKAPTNETLDTAGRMYMNASALKNTRNRSESILCSFFVEMNHLA